MYIIVSKSPAAYFCVKLYVQNEMLINVFVKFGLVSIVLHPSTKSIPEESVASKWEWFPVSIPNHGGLTFLD